MLLAGRKDSRPSRHFGIPGKLAKATNLASTFVEDTHDSSSDFSESIDYTVWKIVELEGGLMSRYFGIRSAKNICAAADARGLHQ